MVEVVSLHSNKPQTSVTNIVLKLNLKYELTILYTVSSHRFVFVSAASRAACVRRRWGRIKQQSKQGGEWGWIGSVLTGGWEILRLALWIRWIPDCWHLWCRQQRAGQEGKGGKSKAGADTVNKTNVYTNGHKHMLTPCANVTVFLRESSPLCWHILLCFLLISWKQSSLTVAWLLSERLEDSVSGLTPSSPGPRRPSYRLVVPKNVKNAGELSAGLNEAFRGRKQLKLKVWTFITAWSDTMRSFVAV